MAANVVGTIIFFLIVFATIVSVIGIHNFTEAFKKESAVTTYHMADTATSLVNGDHLDAYLNGHEMTEYEHTKALLNDYCRKMSVSLIYVIMVDTSDYGRFISVFNAVDNSVDESEYTPWELGHRRDTTNDEYRRKYQLLYEKEALFETVYRTNPSDGSHPHITTMVPVKNSADDVTAILCMQRPISEFNDARRPYLINVTITALWLSVFAGLLITLVARKHFVAPIRKVSMEAVRFAAENTKGEELGNISHFQEIADLARSIDVMESDMVTYMENLTAVTAEKERIGAELSFARTIQRDSLPNTFPAFPDRNDIDIFASMTPAKEVGGDFYNFFLIDDDHLAIVIGDVSGKGVPAALFMMETNIVISGRVGMGGSPAQILTFVSNNICEYNKADMFVTLWLGILEISSGKIIAANAGHEDAVILHKNGTAELMKTKHGIAAGAWEDVVYRDFELQLEKGDKLFLYTDGVPEATDRDDRMFTISRMLEVLGGNGTVQAEASGMQSEGKSGTPREILERMQKSLDAFVGDAPQFDDVTMLCLELK